MTNDDVQPLQEVHEGMSVVDVTGARMGTVEMVKFPSDGQATTQGSETRRGGFLFRLFAPRPPGPDVPEPMRSRLMMSGYIRVDGPGLTDTDRFVPANQVARVRGDVVQLAVQRNATMQESS